MVGPEPNPTAAVNPGPPSLAALAAQPDRSAIIMVNLLRFRPDGGREAYDRYGKVASGTVTARGGSVAYAGTVLGSEPAWDTVLLVRYPRRAAYLDMQGDPAYVGAIPDRTRGLSARLLHPFHPVEDAADDSFRVDRTGGSEVFVVALIRYANGVAPGTWISGADVVLRLRADVPLVTDERWDELLLFRYPSPRAVPAHPGPPRDLVDGSLILVTRPA